MATVAETMRRCLLNYPSIFPCPLAVADHWFNCIGNGYEWDEKTGELLACDDSRDNSKMDFSDLIKDAARIAEDQAKDPDNTLNDRFLLQNVAETIQRRFIADNIDAICTLDVITTFFGYRHIGHYEKEPCVRYARALNFPDTINKDWGDALYEHLSHWLYRLNCEYGVSSNYNDVSFWPKAAQEGRAAILAAQERLYPLIHNGATQAQHNENIQKILDKILADKS